ncbi:hypothetical protein Ddye_020761 [Dipteronia dyeriana]|uniref:RING-type domain-containing protein n=1 Tax=Dipteronia dyeriana TaxID=168575 RepID=A0AAD9U0D3_9ROSI|nr:hypothetical protein Ddye_020761 [Dipteronia dyeriana]
METRMVWRTDPGYSRITTSSDTTTLEVPNSPKDSERRITASNTLVSSLSMVATDGVFFVCLEDFQTDLAGKQVPCGHVFRATCISTWLSICNPCPRCRSRCIISYED